MLKIHSKSRLYLVGIEAKYRSRKSGEAENGEEETEEQRLRECKDQLAAEWADLVREAKKDDQPVLGYFTAGT